jgi:hypothetical protein
VLVVGWRWRRLSFEVHGWDVFLCGLIPRVRLWCSLVDVEDGVCCTFVLEMVHLVCEACFPARDEPVFLLDTMESLKVLCLHNVCTNVSRIGIRHLDVYHRISRIPEVPKYSRLDYMPLRFQPSRSLRRYLEFLITGGKNGVVVVLPM